MKTAASGVASLAEEELAEAELALSPSTTDKAQRAGRASFLAASASSLELCFRNSKGLNWLRSGAAFLACRAGSRRQLCRRRCRLQAGCAAARPGTMSRHQHPQLQGQTFWPAPFAAPLASPAALFALHRRGAVRDRQRGGTQHGRITGTVMPCRGGASTGCTCPCQQWNAGQAGHRACCAPHCPKQVRGRNNMQGQGRTCLPTTSPPAPCAEPVALSAAPLAWSATPLALSNRPSSWLRSGAAFCACTMGSCHQLCRGQPCRWSQAGRAAARQGMTGTQGVSMPACHACKPPQ